MKSVFSRLTAPAVSIAAVGAFVATAPAALADSHGCGDNVCVTFTGGGGSDVGVTAWAYAQTVTGYFTLTGPAGYNVSSGTDTWNGGDEYDAWVVTVPSAPSGTYCVTLNGANGQSYGTACEGVG